MAARIRIFSLTTNEATAQLMTSLPAGLLSCKLLEFGTSNFRFNRLPIEDYGRTMDCKLTLSYFFLLVSLRIPAHLQQHATTRLKTLARQAQHKMVTTYRAIVSHISPGLLRNFEYKEHNFSLRLHSIDVLTAQQEVSMCCCSKVVGGFPLDACMENGLCVNTAGAAPTYRRENCTDLTWKSPICLIQFNVCSMVPLHPIS
jgi:hypothetical protein